MTISIITICYNAASDLEKTIKSVAAQKFKDFEYIVIDGKSKDSTLNVIKQNEDVISKWVSEPDNGIYDAMNKGIRMAEGACKSYGYKVDSEVSEIFTKYR